MAKTKINQTTNPSWNTIHIFGYGETQLNGLGLSKKFSTTDLDKVQDVIDNVLSLKPTDVESSDYHCIHIFKDDKVLFISKNSQSFNFTINYTEIDALKVDALVQEIVDKPTEVTDDSSTTSEEVSE